MSKRLDRSIRPDLREERLARSEGCRWVAGVDEVGRGPLAGPLVAAAVVLPWRGALSRLEGLRDSKQLAASQRDDLYERIRELAVAIGVAVAGPRQIDAVGIGRAGRQAMVEAVAALGLTPDWVLVDGLRVPDLTWPQRAIIGGDARCLSIAAASVVAKVVRDRLMIRLDEVEPAYGFARHKGYGTADHLRALRSHGPCAAHRQSFAPVRDCPTSRATAS
ncbi:MAG TPA: ribonuclease HII [Dehalococcoidia bacterium]|nr:ribonuclease HII [Dehalococcoidia bacterium]